jgi:hypothetical protein
VDVAFCFCGGAEEDCAFIGGEAFFALTDGGLAWLEFVDCAIAAGFGSVISGIVPEML